MTLTEWNAYVRLPLDVVRAEGDTLILRDGRRILDLYGGHCVLSLGAGNQTLGATLTRQWNELAFVTNLIDHAPRHAFLRAFEANLPPGDWHVFCSNSGAEANENALKAALHATGRDTVVAFSGAFHGRTAAAAAVTDTTKKASPFSPFHVVRVQFGDVIAARAAITDRVAAVILEPIQSLAGVVDPPHGFLEALREACDASGAAMIFDEVQTGNGRLGTPWAAQYFGVTPDFFTTAKGAAGGVPLGLTVASAAWATRVPGSLFGSTFGGGPLPLALAAEVSRAIAAPGFLERIRTSSAALAAAGLRGPVARVRGAGLLLGLELKPGLTAKPIRDALLREGVLVGTCDDPSVLRLCPALTLEPERAHLLAAALDAVNDSCSSPATPSAPSGGMRSVEVSR
ncbi:MAG: aspartate aminotransferase family protein [Planctomycetes bacterium]|nr:aspartate aminotransferase family protein [Planctomycetota bacterium]